MRGEGGEKRKSGGGGRDEEGEEGETRTKREIFQATRNTVRRDVTHKKLVVKNCIMHLFLIQNKNKLTVLLLLIKRRT